MEESIIEYDKNKTKILRYIMYKKRTEKEIIQKFSRLIEENMLENIIGELKKNGYINDTLYVQKAVTEYMNLQNLSIKEIEYKLYSKGISSDIIEEYFNNNINQIDEYELQSAKKIVIKKQQIMSEDEMKIFLRKKGYKQKNIEEAF